ncbi:MAG: hypothetical protein ABI598_07450 [Chloroflexota bacterium]
MKRIPLLISIVAMLSLGLAAPVLAASPGNDLYGGRTIVGSIPFADSIDTTEATTDATDLEAIGPCGPVPTDASVWYEFTPSADMQVQIDLQGSDYSAAFAVLTGSPGSFSLETCGAPYGGFFAGGETTYTIMIFDYQGDGGGNGGNLSLVLDVAPPAPVVDLTINRVGSFVAKTGIATVRGTVTCTGGEEFGKNFIEISMSQTVGRLIISGYGWAEFTCDGTIQNWSAEILGQNGKFAGGKATVWANAYACGSFDCGFAEASRAITLKR